MIDSCSKRREVPSPTKLGPIVHKLELGKLGKERNDNGLNQASSFVINANFSEKKLPDPSFFLDHEIQKDRTDTTVVIDKITHNGDSFLSVETRKYQDQTMFFFFFFGIKPCCLATSLSSCPWEDPGL